MTFKPSIYSVEGKVDPIQDHILVVQMEQGEKTTEGGIIVMDDSTGRERGIRPRWGRVYKVGPRQYDVKPGQWVLVDHGRWTRGHWHKDEKGVTHYLQKLDPKNNHECVLVVADEAPKDWLLYGFSEEDL